MIFLTINWANFAYRLVENGLLPYPRKFLWSIALCSTNRMDALDRHNGHADKQTNGRISLSACVLKGVWQNLQKILYTKIESVDDCKPVYENILTMTMMTMMMMTQKQWGDVIPVPRSLFDALWVCLCHLLSVNDLTTRLTVNMQSIFIHLFFYLFVYSFIC